MRRGQNAATARGTGPAPQGKRLAPFANPSRNTERQQAGALSCSRNLLASPFSLAASNVWASACLKKLLRSRFRPCVLHRQPPRCRDAGYVLLRLDFQVGESSGPSCSSPSLIIPIVIIPLNSRQLEGKKNPHLSTAREQEMQRLPGKQPHWGRSKGRLLCPRGLLPSLKTSDERCKVCAAQFQLTQSCRAGSRPIHPETGCGGGGPCMGLRALQSLAGRVGLRAAATGARTKSCPKPTRLSHEAGTLLVQISPLFVRNAIPMLFVQACLQGKGGDTGFRHNVWVYFFFSLHICIL